MCDKASCKAVREEEFQLSNFKLDYDEPADFVKMSCNILPSYYPFYRGLIACMFVACLIYSWVVDNMGGIWFAYFTYWCLLVLSINLSWWTAIIFVHWIKMKRAARLGSEVVVYDGMPWSYKVFWVLNNICYGTAPILTFFYWTMVYVDTPITVINVIGHCLNTAGVMRDIFTSRAPIRLLHMYQPMLYMAVYCLFTAIYWGAGGTNREGSDFIYPEIDYAKEPAITAWFHFIMVFIAAPAAHIICWGMFRLRKYICTECCEPCLKRRADKKIRAKEEEAKANGDAEMGKIDNVEGKENPAYEQAD